MNSSVLGMVRATACALSVLAFSTVAVAGTIQLVDPITGEDSGWQATFPDSPQVSLVVDAVTANAVFIEKFVDFDQPPGPGGLFPPVNIDFSQTLPDDQTVPSIVIMDEALTNLTGADWYGFNWLVINQDEVWFDVGLSSGFSTDPFNQQTFGGFLGGDPNRATTLRTVGGIVPYLDTYFPGAGSGELWMSIDLAQHPITSFILKEVPIPEPGTLALLGLAALALVRRR